MKTAEQRFWEKVGLHDNPNTCWIWQGCTSESHNLTYGQFWDGHRMVKAHRFSYELLVGPIPTGRMIDQNEEELVLRSLHGI